MFGPAPSSAERLGDGSGLALLVIEPSSGALSSANAAATALFALDPQAFGELRAADVLGEFLDLTPRHFATRLETAAGSRPISVRLEALQSGPGSERGALLATVRILPEPSRAARAAELPEPGPPPAGSGRLESLYGLVVRGGVIGSDQISAILAEVARALVAQRATLSRIEDDDVVVVYASDERAVGERVPLARSLERAAFLGSGTFAALDLERDSEYAGAAAGARSFLCSAFRVGEGRWALSVGSAHTREQPFVEDDWRYVETAIEALARSIERRESDERIERLAYSDSLTALPNRVAILTQIDDIVAEAKRLGSRVAILYLDIDGFKGVNDTVGHSGGDIVLGEIAERLRATLRREEYVGRLGGDEFVIALPQMTDRREIESIAQRVANVLTYPFAVDDYRFSLAASIGVAFFPEDGSTREELIASADAAMYAAKNEGGSRVRFRDGLGSEDAGLAVPLGSEPRDLAFVLCYQPIVQVASGRVVAAEALIRRIHPIHGLLAPERGWSIARDPAGRRALDRWVLREAAAQARAWQHAGTPLRVDVNLAAYDPDDLEALLADEALAGALRRLRIELSEGEIVGEGDERSNEFVARCAANGIAFVLDRFDGGLGVLGTLTHLPIEAVKLERRLVEAVSGDRTARALVEGTAVVARSLGWSVIAKGVETAAQQETLVALGCDGLQGFFVAHPMTASDFGVWLGDRRQRERRA